MKKLIITEKPSVASDFIKVLDTDYERKQGYFEGEKYVITWCVGHLIALSYPEKYGEEYAAWSFDTLPFIPDKYRYEVIESVKDQFKTVKECLNRKDIDTIYYAGDAGREGEYIQRLVRQCAGRNKDAAEKRIWIDSQTEAEILRGVREAKDISEYENIADSGYMRAIEDYLVGINFSRALSIKYGRAFNNLAKTSKYTPLSTGRVMTCVLGMITDRERAIRNNVEIPFYGVQAKLSDDVAAKWKVTDSSVYANSPKLYNDNSFSKEDYANELLSLCNGKSLTVTKIKKEKEKKNAPLLYNLAELQNDCSRFFKISPDETLQVVQSLYEKKMTTYPRTDARVLSSAIATEIDKNISGLKNFSKVNEFAENILNNQWYQHIGNTKYTNDSLITDHYAIIPTGEAVGQYSGLSDTEKDIYLLIVRRFLSIFYPAAEYEKISVQFSVEKESFFSNSKTLKGKGYLELYDDEENEEEKEEKAVEKFLNSLSEGSSISAEYSVVKGTTSAPRRYTSGSIILAMENAGNLIEDESLREMIKGSGIGTSATRAETIKKLVKNGYIKLNTKTQVLQPSMSGEILYEIVKATVPSLLNPTMTASWEKGLSAIVDGTVSKDEYLQKMNYYIKTEIENIKANNVMENLKPTMKELGSVYKDIGDMDVSSGSSSNVVCKCPKCGKDIGKFDWGMGCKGYKEGCKVAIRKELFGAKLTERQMKTLIEKGKVKDIKCHSDKKNKDYTANLVMDYDTGKVNLDFDK